MNSIAIDYASECLYLVLMISLPPIVIASLIGIVLSLIQAVTQLQEQTLVFGVKLIAVVGTLFVLGGWMSREILQFAAEIFERFYLL
ncbi:type III secretion system export apparatus subunit SctS [Sutterella massiliensis]|uniref:Type III secretion system export apparatus subunit SctS n=1 Tax=Sutterella massiliensis TaxID=1816689 RepID=A0ABS2DSK2_9BURK|nr:type III secretion system export apparatus subunit SctS [Sutterella massiliensis]MBM6704315.1 type III secretion system export apparatus subunit SctS [Sutterella massiliensis]